MAYKIYKNGKVYANFLDLEHKRAKKELIRLKKEQPKSKFILTRKSMFKFVKPKGSVFDIFKDKRRR